MKQIEHPRPVHCGKQYERSPILPDRFVLSVHGLYRCVREANHDGTCEVKKWNPNMETQET